MIVGRAPHCSLLLLTEAFSIKPVGLGSAQTAGVMWRVPDLARRFFRSLRLDLTVEWHDAA